MTRETRTSPPLRGCASRRTAPHTWITVGVVLCGLWGTGCVEKQRPLSAVEKSQLATFVSKQKPTPSHRLDVDLDSKIALLGYDVTPARAKPGDTVQVTLHWHCKVAVGHGWKLFTHVADASGQNKLNTDGESYIRRVYPPSRWKNGEYIRDVMRLTLTKDWQGDVAAVYTGIWRRDDRLAVLRGPHDGDNRVRVLSLPVEGGATTPAAPKSLKVSWVPDLALTLDGELNELAWQTAAKTGAFVNTQTGGPGAFHAEARVLASDEGLVIAFEVADQTPNATYNNKDDHLWEQDCVEVMIDPGRDQKNYFEVQVSPTGVSFDTFYPRRRHPQPFGHVDWDSQVRSGVTQSKENGGTYTVELLLPWQALRYRQMATTPVDASQTLGLNLFVMDKTDQGQNPAGQRAVGWSPPRVGDFHALKRFGAVTFVPAS